MTSLQRWMHVWLGAGDWPWFRRWVGGRWEQWWVDPCKSLMWMHEPEYTSFDKTRPAACFGTPTIEVHAKLPPARLLSPAPMYLVAGAMIAVGALGLALAGLVYIYAGRP